jgi:hypothetical protein
VEGTATLPPKSHHQYNRVKVSIRLCDDDTLKQLLRIDDELMRLCSWLNEQRDTTISARLIPLVT